MDVFGSAILLPAALPVNSIFNFLLFCQFLPSSLFLESPAFPEFRFTSHSSSYANVFFFNEKWWVGNSINLSLSKNICIFTLTLDYTIAEYKMLARQWFLLVLWRWSFLWCLLLVMKSLLSANFCPFIGNRLVLSGSLQGFPLSLKFWSVPATSCTSLYLHSRAPGLEATRVSQPGWKSPPAGSGQSGTSVPGWVIPTCFAYQIF